MCVASTLLHCVYMYVLNTCTFFFCYKNALVNILIHKGFHSVKVLSLVKFLEGQRIFTFIIFICLRAFFPFFFFLQNSFFKIVFLYFWLCWVFITVRAFTSCSK